jgi:Domain of unknown function (DUF4252)
MTVKTLGTGKLIIIIFIIGLSTVSSASAQNARLEIDQLDKLFPKAVQTIDVRVDSSLLQMAAKFLKTDNPDEAMARELLSTLKGVFVKGVEFDKEGEFTDTDLEAIRTQLRAPGWNRVVGVRSKRDGENAEVYLMLEDSVIAGVSVLVFDPKQLFIVNVVGPLDPEKIGQLRGRFGIPKEMDIDWSGVNRKKAAEGENR